MKDVHLRCPGVQKQKAHPLTNGQAFLVLLYLKNN